MPAAVPTWMVGGLTAADYDFLSEDICRRIEVVDGAILVQPAPSRLHQRIVRRVATALDTACRPNLAAVSSVDLRLREVPLLNRRPDIVVYTASLSDDVVLRPPHCRLVVEVMSSGSVTTDQNHKPAEYAAAGIEHFWRVENFDDVSRLTVFRFRLDLTTRTYVPTGASTGKLVVSDPFEVSIDFAELL